MSKRNREKREANAREKLTGDVGRAEYDRALPDYLRRRVVCDKCGQEQPFRTAAEDEELAACVGAARTAVPLRDRDVPRLVETARARLHHRVSCRIVGRGIRVRHRVRRSLRMAASGRGRLPEWS